MRHEELGVARAVVELAESAPADRLDLLVRHCTRLTHATAIAVAEAGQDGSLRPGAASDEAAGRLMRTELSEREGPTLDCFRYGRALHAAPLLAHGPWPAVAAVARTAGFTTVDALPLAGVAGPYGVLSLYSSRPSPLGHADRAVATALADITGIAIAQTRDVTQAAREARELRDTLERRLVIEQAKGLLAGRDGITIDAALERLTRLAYEQDAELHAAAAALIAAHTPGSRPPG